MKCKYHSVAVDEKTGNLWCPECKNILSDSQALECIREILVEDSPVDFVFSFLKALSDGVKTGNMEKAVKIYETGLRKRKTERSDN